MHLIPNLMVSHISVHYTTGTKTSMKQFQVGEEGFSGLNRSLKSSSASTAPWDIGACVQTTIF